MAFRNWYEGDCAAIARSYAAPVPRDAISPVAIVCPHAGWRYSGRIAARSVATLTSQPPELVIGFSAIHRTWLERAAIWTEGAWETPLGDLDVDTDFTSQLLDELGADLEDNSRVHDDEHAIEVLAPLVRHFIPGAKLVAIMVPPDGNAVALGESTARVAVSTGMRIAAIASTDLTHYGDTFHFTPAGHGRAAHEWMRANDSRLLRLVETLDADAIVPETREHHNACGAGALAAAVAFARSLGARQGTVLEHTDSHLVTTGGHSPREDFEMAVGYAAATISCP